MKEKTWKVLAIVFIVIAVLEFSFIAWIISSGSKAIENENECMINTCGPEEYDSYYFDSTNDMCYCYTNGEVTNSEYIN